MGKIYLKKSKLNIFRCAFIALLIPLFSPSPASAQGILNSLLGSGNQCVSVIINPAAGSETAIHAYGVPREEGRNHHGVDIMMPMCLPVQNQPNCEMILNDTNSSPLWSQGSGPGSGYGFFTRYKCGPRVEVRYTHINGYNATSQMVINGQSGAARGTGAHIHYEVVVYNESGQDGIKVDPQCVWGAHPNQPDCCINVGAGCDLGIEPVDMCDDSRLNQLRSNARSSRTQGLSPTNSRYTDTFNNGETIDPQNVPPGNYGEDLPNCEENPPTQDISQSDEGLGEDESLITNEGTEVIPGTELGPDPEPVPPLPPIPGTPGGPPNLVPEPEEETDAVLSGCAADTWTAMVNQAVMQARREDVFNKHFIVKADSVLDYSCFSEHIKKTYELAGPIFSETMLWDDLPVDILDASYDVSDPSELESTQFRIRLQTKEEDNDPFFSEAGYNFEREYTQSDGTVITYNLMSANSLDVAIDSIVGQAAQAYLEGHFGHGYLAETTPTPGVSLEDCNLANVLWEAEMCKNFGSPDLFSTLDYLATNDPRDFPGSMACF